MLETKPQVGRVIAILRNRPVRTKTRLLGRGMICGAEAGAEMDTR